MGTNRLGAARSLFEARIDDAEQFVLRCHRSRHHAEERPGFTLGQIEWGAEAALLKLVLGGERFFEIAMALYVLGERSPRGYRPRRLRRFDAPLREVLDVFRGDQAYIGWTSPDVVIKRAERWVKAGEPFQTTLSGASQLLGYLVKMRNVVAHESDSAFEKYRNATRALYGGLPKRVYPGRQLMAPPPTGIAYLTGPTLFDAALAAYRLIAARIVP